VLVPRDVVTPAWLGEGGQVLAEDDQPAKRRARSSPSRTVCLTRRSRFGFGVLSGLLIGGIAGGGFGIEGVSFTENPPFQVVSLAGRKERAPCKEQDTAGCHDDS
jgi:hypothetical protein